MSQIFSLLSPFIAIIALLILWSAIWKGIALWKSARNNQMMWFIVLLIVNTAGILEIIYFLFFQRKRQAKNRK